MINVFRYKKVSGMVKDFMLFNQELCEKNNTVVTISKRNNIAYLVNGSTAEIISHGSSKINGKEEFIIHFKSIQAIAKEKNMGVNEVMEDVLSIIKAGLERGKKLEAIKIKSDITPDLLLEV